jgi:hypothetical protein
MDARLKCTGVRAVGENLDVLSRGPCIEPWHLAVGDDDRG